jgi:hypothetical protein
LPRPIAIPSALVGFDAVLGVSGAAHLGHTLTIYTS